MKEHSFALVKVYEGSYDNNDVDENGIMNAVIQGNKMEILAYSDIHDEFWTSQLDVVNNTVTGDEISGTINGNIVSGVWFDSMDGESGNWIMNRSF